MNNSEGAIIVLIGMLAGMLLVLAAMARIPGTYLKVPGGESARYWALGSALILTGMTIFILRGAQNNFLLNMATLGAAMNSGHNPALQLIPAGVPKC